jgi:hypothetical protein
MSDRVLLDPAAAYPEVTKVRAALAARDWGGVRTVVDAAPPVGRSMLLRYGADGDHLEDFLRYVVATDPADSAAAAMLAMHLIDIGWKIRTGYRANHVSREQFASFHDWLRKAEVVLLDGVARNPADPALWVARITSARGLQLGLAETRRRYQRLAAIDPHHLPGQTQYLQRLCPKWSGSWELLFEWSRDAMRAAPPGGPQALLVAEAHIERWADESPDGRRYMRDPAVRAEIYEAAQRSVLHPEFRRDYGWVQLASTFAMLFVLIDDRDGAAAMFRMLGDLGTELPWGYLGDDAPAAIAARRRWALGTGGSR